MTWNLEAPPGKMSLFPPDTYTAAAAAADTKAASSPLLLLLLLSLLQLNCFQVRLFTESRTAAAATLQEEGGTAADGHMADYAAAAADAVSLEAN